MTELQTQLREALYLDHDELLCKFVRQDMSSGPIGFNTVWEVGVQKSLRIDTRNELCRYGVFHYYRHPLQAFIFNDDHASFLSPRLFTVEVAGQIINGVDKSGATTLTLKEELEVRITQSTWPKFIIKNKLDSRRYNYFSNAAKQLNIYSIAKDYLYEAYYIPIFDYDLNLLKGFTEMLVEEMTDKDIREVLCSK